MSKPKNETPISLADALATVKAEMAKLGTGVTFLQQDDDTILFALNLSHEGYTTKPKAKKMADGSEKLSGGGNIMVGTSHGNQPFVNANGEEVKIGINAYKKAPKV